MGQAKVNKQRDAAADAAAEAVDFARIAATVRKLAIAASGQLGADCVLHAGLAQHILSRLDVPSRMVLGFAAWRVGPGDGDVIVHGPVKNTPPQPGVPFHAWLEVGSRIFDVTTYALTKKAQDLDRLDGGTTTVEWCPDYLLIAKEGMVGVESVARGDTGVFDYKPIPGLESIVGLKIRPPEPGDCETAWLLYQNPEIHVLGPYNLGAVSITEECPPCAGAAPRKSGMEP